MTCKMLLDLWLNLKLPPDLNVRAEGAPRRKADLSCDLTDAWCYILNRALQTCMEALNPI